MKICIHNGAINIASSKEGVSEQTAWRPGTCQLKTEVKQGQPSLTAVVAAEDTPAPTCAPGINSRCFLLL